MVAPKALQGHSFSEIALLARGGDGGHRRTIIPLTHNKASALTGDDRRICPIAVYPPKSKRCSWFSVF